MSNEKADTTTYESREETTGHQHLQWSLCGAAALPAEEGGVHTAGVSRCSGSENRPNNLRLGIGKFTAKNIAVAGFSRTSRRRSPHNSTEKIVSRKILNTPYCDFLSMCYTISRPVRREFSNTEKSALCTLVALARSFDWTSKQKRVFHVPNPLTRKEKQWQTQ